MITNLKHIKRILTVSVVFIVSLMFGLLLSFRQPAAAEGTADPYAIKMERGASVRLAADSNGLRFVVYMENADYAELTQSEGVSFGILIAPKDYDDENPIAENTFTENPVYGYAEKDESGNYVYDEAANAGKTRIINLTSSRLYHSAERDRMEFMGALVDIREENIPREFVGRGYIKYSDGGAVRYVFAQDNDNTRSIAYVAQKAVEDESVSEADKELLQTAYIDKAQTVETTYTVEHYTETENSEFILHSQESLSANIAATVSSSPKEIEGYAPVTGEGNRESVVYANGKTVIRHYYFAAPEENEVNSLKTKARYTNNVSAAITGQGDAKAITEYYTGSVGGVTGGYLKSTYDTPDDTKPEAWQRGERLRVEIGSLNTLQSLKDAGYTKIVVPMYLTAADGIKPESWRTMGNGDWWTYILLEENKWTNFEYDIDKAIGHFRDNILKFEIANYSGDYPEGSKKNVDITVYFGGIYATGKPEAVAAEANEVNSFKTNAHYENNVIVAIKSPGESTGSAEYYTGTVGGVTGNFAKATHHVPDDSVTDPRLRGERLQVKIRSLNTLQALKDAGYTKIVIPMYLTAEGTTPESWRTMRNGDYWDFILLKKGEWTNLEFDIDKAIELFKDDILMIEIANYSGDYPTESQKNVDITVYFGGIFAA